MATMTKHLTPIALIRAIDKLTDEERETLAILADKKLSATILRRRKEALGEMRRGKLLAGDEIFGKTFMKG